MYCRIKHGLYHVFHQAAIQDSKYGTTHVLFASTYTAKRAKNHVLFSKYKWVCAFIIQYFSGRCLLIKTDHGVASSWYKINVDCKWPYFNSLFMLGHFIVYWRHCRSPDKTEYYCRIYYTTRFVFELFTWHLFRMSYKTMNTSTRSTGTGLDIFWYFAHALLWITVTCNAYLYSISFWIW